MHIDKDITYKFLPSERLSYLKDGLLRITQPSELNDPFECVPSPPSETELISLFREILHDKFISWDRPLDFKQMYEDKLVHEFSKINSENPGNYQNKFNDEAVAYVNRHVGILSLTKRWDSTLMWSHYSESHRGFCVGYDRNHFFFDDYKRSQSISKIFKSVEYSQSRISIPIKTDSLLNYNIFFRKAFDWNYEMEERLIMPLKFHDKIVKNALTPIFLVNVPHSAIREIIIGVNASFEVEKSISKFCRDNSINMFKAKIADFKFDMERTELKQFI